MPEFVRQRIGTGAVELQVAIGGEGPPLLLLHGFPETHLAWHAVAPALARQWTVVCPDLRGYGESDKPPGDEAHEQYSKRTMARDMVTLMDTLGHGRFAVAGHDRGAVVAYRLALDHPAAVTRLAVMSVLPVVDQWDTLRGQAGLGAYHLYLLAQPPDFPERLIGANPDLVLQSFLDGWCATPGAIVAEARAEYARAFRDPRTLHAICEDYRANASIDVEHDRADRAAGRRIMSPLLVLWEQPPEVELPFDPLAVWRQWADDVRGHALDCGHFLPEERPREVAAALASFFA
ncbi:MAG: alpha/beta hydrolase [Chloroflexota bacterium]|nr:alpha/beta hydrolase [Chloroflexota bacterium]